MQGKMEDTGEPLILTDYLSNGNDAKARRLARVNPQYFLDVVSYSGKCNLSNYKREGLCIVSL